MSCIKGNYLLICLAAHYTENRYVYLKTVLNRLLTSYNLPLHIIIDTNSQVCKNEIHRDFQEYVSSGIVEVCVTSSLSHPYHLTWIHRDHILNNINSYEVFMYLEDDMDVPFESFQNYMSNMDIFPEEYIPALVRLEKFDNNLYCTDFGNPHPGKEIITVGNRKYMYIDNLYFAMWIYPGNLLRKNLTPDFNSRTSSREDAASFPVRRLRRKPLVELNEIGQLSEKCYIYHLPNNYVAGGPKPGNFASVRVDLLFQ